jgi:DNA-nicking Smr family endonuclease
MARIKFKKSVGSPIRQRQVSEQELALFRLSVSDVQPLSADRVALRKPAPKASALHSHRDNIAVMQELASAPFDLESFENGDQLCFARPGFQLRQMRKLKRGSYCVEAELDLHGFTVKQAQFETARFIHQCQQLRLKTVRIIHGKGNSSRGNIPKIKQNLDRWLRQWDAVFAYCSARDCDGGTGAIYVLLRHCN